VALDSIEGSITASALLVAVFSAAAHGRERRRNRVCARDDVGASRAESADKALSSKEDNMSRSTLIGIALTIAAATAVAGCGDDGARGTAASTRPATPAAERTLARLERIVRRRRQRTQHGHRRRGRLPRREDARSRLRRRWRGKAARAE